jgi:ABC-type nitrate/sulfonate/bicarbonate transport system substrate-binding protein
MRVYRVFCRSGIIAALVLCFWFQSGIAAEKIRIATGGLAASSAAVWAGLETKSFQKHGLEPEYIIIDNGTVSGQALLAGELQYLISHGSIGHHRQHERRRSNDYRRDYQLHSVSADRPP